MSSWISAVTWREPAPRTLLSDLATFERLECTSAGSWAALHSSLSNVAGLGSIPISLAFGYRSLQ